MKITPKQYAKALYDAVQGKSAGETKAVIGQFANLVISHNDTKKFPAIIRAFGEIWNKEQGIATVEVTSARELDNDIVKLLDGYMAELLKVKKVEITQSVDARLLGGLVIKSGDQVMDASLRNKVANLKDILVK